MKVSKRLKISGFIVKPDNIRELAKKIYEEYEGDKESNHDSNINFILRGIDGTQYESQNYEIFLDGGILDTRRIIAVKMTYSDYTDYTDEKRVSIELEHTITNHSWGNVISVSGHDEIWVNGIIKGFEDTIANWEKQVNWLHKYSWFLTIIFAIGIGLLYLNILDFIFTYGIVVHPVSPKPQWAIELRPLFIFFYYASGILLGYWPGSYIVNKLKELYPIVELKTGLEHTQVEAKKRKKLYAVISMGIIPLIISLIVELIKIIR